MFLVSGGAAVEAGIAVSDRAQTSAFLSAVFDPADTRLEGVVAFSVRSRW